MKLDLLLDGLERLTAVRELPSGIAGVEIGRVVADTRRVRPGDAFCAIPGHAADGHRFVGQAVAAGASAVIVERPVDTGPVPRVVVDSTRRALGWLAHRCLGDPTRRMSVVGVTGTNGKTTTTYIIESILRSAGLACGVLGTVSYRLGSRELMQRATHVTTPGADELAELFADMMAVGARHAAMEVSSHALDQGRTDSIRFASAIFTNLTGDHADYHTTPEHYRDAKTRLFSGLPADASAIINRDSPAGEWMAKHAGGRVVWYGLSPSADVGGRIDRLTPTGSVFQLSLPGQPPVSVRLPLIGRHNVSNALGAAAAAWLLDIDASTIAAGLESLAAVPGRLEPVRMPDGRPAPRTVMVDYAHTDDALDNVLSAARPLAGGNKLILVFGCGGDRDSSKRPRMARVAQRWADRIVVTSDNPRSEDPDSIIDQIVAGFSSDGLAKCVRRPDRRSAIALAIEQADAADVVLICGKGHEDYQIIGPNKVHFDDREVAAEIMASVLTQRK